MRWISVFSLLFLPWFLWYWDGSRMVRNDTPLEISVCQSALRILAERGMYSICAPGDAK